MHPSDRRFFVGLGWLGIPAAMVAAGGWGVFSGYPHAGSAVAFVGLVVAYFMSLYLTERKPHKLPRPAPIVVSAAVLSWLFIAGQIWTTLHALDAQKAKLPPPTVVHVAPTPEQIAKAGGDALSAVTSERDALKRDLETARRAHISALPVATPSTAVPSISGEKMLALAQHLRGQWMMNLSPDDKRYVVITSPPDQQQIQRLLTDFLQIALPEKVLVYSPPDLSREFNVPVFSTPLTNGIVLHGNDSFNQVLTAALQQCFVVKFDRTTGPPAGLNEYYKISAPILWVAIGTGSPWKSQGSC